MLVILYVELNVVGMITLLLLLRNIRHNEIKEQPVDQLLFNSIMWTVLFIMLFDTGLWLLDGQDSRLFHALNYISATAYYVLNPVLCVLWLMYTDYKINESLSDLKKRMSAFMIPAVLCSIIAVCSPVTGWFFTIDSSNHYARGSVIWIMEAIGAAYLLVSAAMPVLDYRKSKCKESKKVNLYLVMFPMSIFLCTVIQYFFYGMSIIWMGALLACISLFINIQNREISTDHLTGLFNRRRLEQHLQRRMKGKRRKRILFAIMMDMDEFKFINDTMGHLAGDMVLCKIAEILKRCCDGTEDIAARLGGDEFILVGERNTEAEIKELLHTISEAIDRFNDTKELPNEIMISMGYSMIGEGDSIEALLDHADKEMYLNKSDRKSVNRK